MKKRALILILCFSLLLPLASCARERFDELYTETVGELTFAVRGKNTRPRQIVVKRGEEILWAKKVKVKKDLGAQGGNYGFVATDLNFDGTTDFMIADEISGDCISYLCYLWNTEKETFQYSKELSELYNIRPDSEKKALRGFTHVSEKISRREVVITDAATMYIWKDGALTPERRISLTYYSETDAYCLSARIYNPETSAFDLDIESFPDKWFLTEEALKDYDLSQLYYFR